MSPDKLKGLSARNLRGTNKGFHLRRNSAGLHDASELAFASGGLLGSGGKGRDAHRAQGSRGLRVEELGTERRGGGGKRHGERSRFSRYEGGEETSRHSHCRRRLLCQKERIEFAETSEYWVGFVPISVLVRLRGCFEPA